MTEFGFIDSIKTLFAPLPDNGFEGIGDDCSVLSVGGGESLVFTAGRRSKYRFYRLGN